LSVIQKKKKKKKKRKKEEEIPRAANGTDFFYIAGSQLSRKRVDSVAFYKALYNAVDSKRSIIKMTKRSSRLSWIYIIARAPCVRINEINI